jgi:hypothetical protein
VKSLNITPGNYTISSLISFLNTAFNNDAIILTTSTSTYNITFSSTSNFSILKTSSACNVLGLSTLSNSSPSLINGNYILVSPKAYNLSGVNNILVMSNFITSNLDGRTKRNSNFLKSIPITQSPGNIEVYCNTMTHQSRIYDTHISFIVINLQDENQNTIDLNGSDWDMTILCEMIPKELSETDDDLTSSLYDKQQQINKMYNL